MSRLIKRVEIDNLITTVTFTDAEGRFHRDGGPAIITIDLNWGIYRYTYYQYGRICRPDRKGIEQPAYICKAEFNITYRYYHNGQEYRTRGGGQLPYEIYIDQHLSMRPGFGYILRYSDTCVIHCNEYLVIKYNNHAAVSACRHIATYGLLTSGHGYFTRGQNQSNWPISPERAHNKIGTLATRGFAYLPLSRFL